MTTSDTPVEPVREPDEVFAALGHSRRRYLLYTLAKGRREETLSEVATNIAAWERDTQADEVSDDERRRVHVSLYHSHVPNLADLGVLEYRETTDSIVRARNTSQVEAVLDGAGAELDSRQEDHAKEKMSNQPPHGGSGPDMADERDASITDQWVQVNQAYYDCDGDEELVTAFVSAVADATGVDPLDHTAMPPLYEAIDAHSLEETVCGPPGTDTQRNGSVSVTFVYNGHKVTLRGDGWIFVYESQ